MAIYHLCVKTISRSAGRSVTAAAAYRAAEKIVDERTGEIHDYTHKKGVLSVDIILPQGAPEWASDRAKLWNAAEQSETRKNSTVGREFEIALPDDLNESERRQLALALAREIVARHDCVADVAIHEPSKSGDNRNHHAHILCSTRRLGPFGFHAKTRELDEVKQGEVVRWRERFAIVQNQHLREAGHAERVDHRTLEAQGIDRVPTVHLGPSATNYERRTGKPSHRREELDQEISERLRSARNQGQLERQSSQLEHSIIDTSGDLAAAQKERASIHQQATAGRAIVRAQFEQYKQEKAAQERQQAEAEKAHQLAETLRQAAQEIHRQAEAKRQADIERKRQELEQAKKPKKDLDRGGHSL
jgi:ATP-dependent exoDNAse (exonuclease V) alpha subunit